MQARTIEWGDSYLPSEYVIVPRGQDLVSYTPTGVNGLRFRAKYGLVGLAIDVYKRQGQGWQTACRIYLAPSACGL